MLKSLKQQNLQLLHQLAVSFASGSNDAVEGPRVQVEVLAHQLLTGPTRFLQVPLVPGDQHQVLRVVSNTRASRCVPVHFEKCDQTTHLETDVSQASEDELLLLPHFQQLIYCKLHRKCFAKIFT